MRQESDLTWLKGVLQAFLTALTPRAWYPTVATADCTLGDGALLNPIVE